MRSTLTTFLTVALVLGVATLAHASGETAGGWGPRVGFAGDPDQLVLGAHIDAARVAPRVRFQPDVELGIGDNFTILGFTAPLHYRFAVSSNLKPYAGAGVTLGWVNVDSNGQGDDDDFEAALDLIGGLEFPLKSGNLFFTEFDILVGDLQDFQLIAGWTFR